MAKNKTNTTNHKYNTNLISNNPLILKDNTTNNKTDTINYKHNTKIKNKLQSALIINNNTQLKTVN